MKMNFWEAVQAMKNGKVVTSEKSDMYVSHDFLLAKVFYGFCSKSGNFFAETYCRKYGPEYHIAFSADEILTETWEIIHLPKLH